MLNNKKDLFYIADLCKINKIKQITDEKKHTYTRYYYNLIGKKIVYIKKNNYIDIETNEKYTTSYKNKGDKFIRIGSIIPFSDYLRTNRIQYNNNDIKNKQKVKELYNKYQK